MTTKQQVRETISTVAPTKGGLFRVRIISAGIGSSGYYSPDVIKDAVERGVFHKGLQSYLDHPTKSEEGDRPERTVRDLVGVLNADAIWNGEAQAAEVEMKVYAPYRPQLAEMANDIGLSIRAYAEVLPGRVNGQSMPVVKQLTEAISVDFVTQAGRGGRVLEVLESARTGQQPYVNPWGRTIHPEASPRHTHESSNPWGREVPRA